ncbi:hypothetical protein ACJX0J_006883, partial [Zea mays]
HRCIYKYLYQKHEDTLRRQLKHHTTFLLLGARFETGWFLNGPMNQYNKQGNNINHAKIVPIYYYNHQFFFVNLLPKKSKKIEAYNLL